MEIHKIAVLSDTHGLLRPEVTKLAQSCEIILHAGDFDNQKVLEALKGVDKSFAIQAGREVRVIVVPDQIDDDAMVLLARDISKQIESELQYPGQIKVNVIRESRVVDYAK